MQKNTRSSQTELVNDFLDLIQKHKENICPHIGISLLTKILCDVSINSSESIADGILILQNAIAESVQEYMEEQ